MTKVAVFGASGFVGATLVERLFARGHVVQPLIHSTASAWRLGRYGMELHPVELLDRRDIRAALGGCTHVVNCARGPRAVMLEGLRNLLDVCGEMGMQRFVHLSSVAVYGDPPPPESTHEDAPTKPALDSYGWTKLQQDEMVQVACRQGLPSVILCPPYISGAYSNFMLRLLGAIEDGSFALVDSGAGPSNLVDVQNLAQAIELALDCREAKGERIFITNGGEITWRQVAEALLPLAGRPVALKSVPVADAHLWSRNDPPPKPSVLRSLRRFATSTDVKSILREDPLVRACYLFVQKAGRSLSPVLAERLRARVNPPPRVVRPAIRFPYDKQLLSLQLRGVRHNCDRARTLLNYTPELSFVESMEAFATWYCRTHGWGSDYAQLFAELNRGGGRGQTQAEAV